MESTKCFDIGQTSDRDTAVVLTSMIRVQTTEPHTNFIINKLKQM